MGSSELAGEFCTADESAQHSLPADLIAVAMLDEDEGEALEDGFQSAVRQSWHDILVTWSLPK